MVVMIQASNVTGEVFDIRSVGKLCKEKGILFVVDTAQSAGDLPCAEFGEAVFQRTNFGDVPQHGVPVSGYVWSTGGIL